MVHTHTHRNNTERGHIHACTHTHTYHTCRTDFIIIYLFSLVVCHAEYQNVVKQSEKRTFLFIFNAGGCRENANVFDVFFALVAVVVGGVLVVALACRCFRCRFCCRYCHWAHWRPHTKRHRDYRCFWQQMWHTAANYEIGWCASARVCSSVCLWNNGNVFVLVSNVVFVFRVLSSLSPVQLNGRCRRRRRRPAVAYCYRRLVVVSSALRTIGTTDFFFRICRCCSFLVSNCLFDVIQKRVQNAHANRHQPTTILNGPNEARKIRSES